MESWLKSFNFIRPLYEYLHANQNTFTIDLKKYLEALHDGKEKEFYEKFDYGSLLSTTYWGVYKELVKKVDEINAKQLLLEQYDPEKRIPNLSTIFFLFSISFVTGILLPLLLPSSFMSYPIKLTLVLISFIPLIVIIFSTISEFKKTGKYDFAYEYICPLKKQLVNYQRSEFQDAIFNYDLVNQLLKESKKKNISKGLLNFLEQYRQLVIDSNNLSEKVVDDVLTEIKNNHYISELIGKGSGQRQPISFLKILSADNIEVDLKTNDYI